MKKKVPRNHRICNFSKYNNIDDEFHFFFHCERNCDIRNKNFLYDLTFEKKANELSEIKKKIEMNSKREFIRFKVLTSCLRRLIEDSRLSD